MLNFSSILPFTNGAFTGMIDTEYPLADKKTEKEVITWKKQR